MSGRSGSEGSSTTTGLKRGPWTTAEDAVLLEYVRKYGEGNWNSVHRTTGLSRCGKSCRLRWANHLRPNLKKGSFSPEEERLVLELHATYGNKWAHMASQLPGRTDNEIKNFWNTRIKRRQRSGLPMYPSDINSRFCKLPTYPTNCNIQYATKSSFNGNLRGFDDSLLSDIEQRPKRLRVDNGSFASDQVPGIITSLSCYNLGNFDVGMHNFYPVLQQPQLSMQMGLPSSQLFSSNGYKYKYEYDTDISPLNHDNSGLLQSVLEGVRGLDSKSSAHNSGSHVKPLIDDLKQSSFNVSDNEPSHSTVVSGMATQSGTMDDDLSALIGILHPSSSPAPVPAPAKWEEAECKGSSTVNFFLGATDSSIPKLEMQPTSNEEQAWNIASCQWKNMPRIC